jgi:ketosteroid isomerase-like protein
MMPNPSHCVTRARGRRRFVALATLAGIGLIAVEAAAHDFWIIPSAFQIGHGETLELLGQTSTRFPSSLSAVATPRVADARLIGAAGTTRITELSQRGTSLLLRGRPSAPGQYLVAVALTPTPVRSPAAAFHRWLELEGAPGEAARLEREGAFQGSDSVTRRTLKTAKTIAQVGSGGPRMFGQPAGQPLEFILDADPATLRVGDTLGVRMMYNGRPVARGEAHAGGADWPIAEGEQVPEPQDVHLRATGQGVLRLPITRGGVWNVRGIHVTPGASGTPREWDVHWATLVFQVGGASSATGGAATPTSRAATTDSADVVQTVRRLDQLVESGDSLGVMALLTDDAVVLENGGIESRAEFRSHHLASDIEFSRAVKSTDTIRSVTVRGDAAWVASTSVSQGTFRGRAINTAGAELVTLVRTPAGWRISAIHWSSRARRG